jgi:hypothetical protein
MSFTDSITHGYDNGGQDSTVKQYNIDSTQLKELFRKLFTDHAVYTKFYIESVLNNTPDTRAIANRLFKNQTEIGTYVGTIVGQEKGTRLAQALKNHIKAVANVVNIAHTGNGNLEGAKAKLFANGEDIAKLLNKLNPRYLQYQVVKIQFGRHNQYVLDMINDHIGKHYDHEIEMFDAYYNHMLMFSDMLYDALKPHPFVKPQMGIELFGHNMASCNNNTMMSYNMMMFCLSIIIILVILFHLKNVYKENNYSTYEYGLQ